MKKLILILALIFSASSTMISCRDTTNDDTVEDAVDDMGDGIEEAGDDIEDEF